jgi:hypothetical protein
MKRRKFGELATGLGMGPEASSACGLKLLVYEALSYECMRP